MFGKSKNKKQFEPAKPDRSALVPRIKHLQFIAGLKQMNIPEDQLPYTEPLVADLIVAYAFDLPDMFQMASVADIQELGIPKEEIRSVAITNLKKQLPEIGISDHGPISRIVTGENLEACTLLGDRFWDEIASNAKGDLVVAVPGRDYVLFCDSNVEDSLDTLQAVCEQLIDEDESNHTLTDRFLTRRDGRWVEYQFE